MIEMNESASIHPTAIISPQAEIGKEVSVGPYSIIGDGVILHDGVRVGSHCVIEGPSEFGSGTRFFPFVSAGQAPHDLKYKGEPSRLRVGERNVFREFTTIHRGTEGGGNVTEIGADNLFMAQVHIAHDCPSATIRFSRRPRRLQVTSSLKTSRRSARLPACINSAASVAMRSSARHRSSSKTHCRLRARSAITRVAMARTPWACV